VTKPKTTKITARKSKKTVAKKATRGVVLPTGMSPTEVLDAAVKGDVIVLTFPNWEEGWKRAYTLWSLRKRRGLVETIGVSFNREAATLTVGPKAKVARKHTTTKAAPKKVAKAKKTVAKATKPLAKVTSIAQARKAKATKRAA